MATYIGSVVAFLAILSYCCVVIDAAPPALFVFGDSLVDSGNNNYLATAARADMYPYGIDYPTHRATGRFSNGYNIPDYISMKLGTEPVLPYLNPALGGNALLRGANFASAGVGILNDTGIQFVNIIRMPQQLEYFEEYQNRVAQLIGRAETNRLVSTALVSITVGGNDYVNNYYLTPLSVRRVQYPNIADYTRLVVSEYEKLLRRLYSMGVRRVKVTSTGPLGCVPAERAARGTNGACAVELQQAAALFNAGVRIVINRLNNEVAAQRFTFADSYTMRMDLFGNAAAYGFSDSVNACCGQGPYNGLGLCNAASYLCTDRNSHLYWDNFHPSEKANRLIVDGFFSGPSSVMSPINLSQMLNITQMSD